MDNNKKYAPRNRTLTMNRGDTELYAQRLMRLDKSTSIAELSCRTINQDLFQILDFLPSSFVDLLFIDPPYNLNKEFGETRFAERSFNDYAEWVESWFSKLMRILKPQASVYICADWRSSAAIHLVAQKYLKIQNRITWEREKGRGALSNWKNCAEDIWFCTVSNDYYFNVDAVKLKRRVIAPYRDASGKPRDWHPAENGQFRLTYPSNIWTDLTIPFWSMPENTDHPTQKPEKLLAKIILASSKKKDFVFDPFLGSGTTSAVAKKLDRQYCGVEIDRTYACLAEKRLAMVNEDASIQGYTEGIFWERNTLAYQNGREKIVQSRQLAFSLKEKDEFYEK